MVMGRFRARMPVALWMALATAAAEPAVPSSPMPRAPSGLKVVSGWLRKCTSMGGMSALTGIG
jgi:hypothetical protein